VNKVQQCFAVRTQVDSLLDMSRATFTRLTESIHDLAAKYCSSTGIAALKMQYSAAKGFFIVVPDASAHSAKACNTGLARQLHLQQAIAPQLPKYGPDPQLTCARRLSDQ
jgi:DNA mismatch repair ATPase MutS